RAKPLNSLAKTQRDQMEEDVLIVGAGPAGLAAAIHLKHHDPRSIVCVLRTPASAGGHTLSAAIIETAPLDALWPEWRGHQPAICVPASRDEFRLLGPKGALRLPVPPQQRNHGNLIVSLGQLLPALAEHAESLGVDVLPGFAAAAPLFDDAGRMAGVRVGDMGLDADRNPTAAFAPGPEIRAHTTLVAEGCRGSLAKQLIRQFDLDADRAPQTFALGFKELWQLPPGRVQPGLVQHSVGWPLDNATYGG